MSSYHSRLRIAKVGLTCVGAGLRETPLGPLDNSRSKCRPVIQDRLAVNVPQIGNSNLARARALVVLASGTCGVPGALNCTFMKRSVLLQAEIFPRRRVCSTLGSTQPAAAIDDDRHARTEGEVGCTRLDCRGDVVGRTDAAKRRRCGHFVVEVSAPAGHETRVDDARRHVQHADARAS